MAEKFYGVIRDTVSWERPVDSVRSVAVHGCSVFDANSEVESGPPRVLARTDDVAVYMRTFADGGGENGLHSHPDDAVWLVIDGQAAFHAADGAELGLIQAGQGVLVPAETPYRFAVKGQTTLVRLAAAKGQEATG